MCYLSGWCHIVYSHDDPQDSVTSVQDATDTVFRKHAELNLGVCLHSRALHSLGLLTAWEAIWV